MVSTDESDPHLKLVASGAGAFDDSLLAAIEDDVKRQRRLNRPCVIDKINAGGEE